MVMVAQVRRRPGEVTVAENMVKIRAIGTSPTENIPGKDTRMMGMGVLRSIHSKEKVVIAIITETTTMPRTPKAKRIGSLVRLLLGTTSTGTAPTTALRAGATPVLQVGGTEAVNMRQTLTTPQEKGASAERTRVRTGMDTPPLLPASTTLVPLPLAPSTAQTATPRGITTTTAGPTTTVSRSGPIQPRAAFPLRIGTPRPAGAVNTALRTPFAPEMPPMWAQRATGSMRTASRPGSTVSGRRRPIGT